MTWQQLSSAGRVRPHQTSRQELDDLRVLIERDLSDAGIEELSDDRRFATAYNAVLQLCKMAIACCGHRVASIPGHHQTTFEAAEVALGSAHHHILSYFDTCRRIRNRVDYDAAGVVSKTAADELVEKANEFRKSVEDWIRANHSQFTVRNGDGI